MTKQYSIKTESGNIDLLTAFSGISALVFFLINAGGKLNFPIGLLPYALSFAAAFGTALLTSNLAINTGPLSVTTLITSYSLLIPTFYGIVFLKDSIHITLYIGIAALLVSMYLINVKKDESAVFSPMWIVYIILAFISNGMCSTIQKMQQIHFDGAYKNEFMIIALAVVSIVLSAVGIAKGSNNKQTIMPCLKYGIPKGIFNGLVNYFVMVASAALPNSVLFPSISAGGIVLTFACALTIYKEKLSKAQMIGYFLGIVSVIFLNI